MPVSHIGLTVSHLPTSTSFFLSALQPLGYRYIGQFGNQIGFGIHNADFYLCQETPGVRAGAAHIAFTAASTTAVRNFYTAALTAGGRPNGSPGSRCAEDGHFNAAVLDFDGNSIEVVYRNGPDMRNDGTIIAHSRVITWQRTVSQSFRESPSVFSAHTCASRAGATPVAPPAEAAVPKPPSVARSASAPNVAPVPEAATKSDSGSGAATHILGTLLGAAAGAAVTYAFMRSEKDSTKKEADFSAFMDAKNAVNNAAGFVAQASSQPPTPQQDPQPAQPPIETAAPPVPAQPVHRIEDDARSSYSSTPSRASQIPRTSAPRQIEAAPASYYSPSQFEAPRTQIAEPLAIEYAPAYSVAPSRAPSRLTPAHRSHISPELLMIERARSTVSTAKPENVATTAKPPRPSSKPQSVVSKAQSAAPSAAPSSFISSFVADCEDEKSSSGRSKARSSHSSSSKHTSHKEHKEHGSSSSRKGRSSSPSPPAPASKPPSKVASKAASIVSSILGRDKSKHNNDDDDFIDDLDIEELSEDDLDTVVPSDSISQIGDGPRRRHRSHRSHRTKKDDDAETSVSHRSKKHSDDKESSVSHRSKKHDDDNESSISKSSKRSHRSHRLRKTSADSADDEDSSRPRHSTRSSKSKPSVISEPSEVSTVRPVKPSKTSRKDSLTQGQYDNLFDEVQYGTGAVHASRHPPTPSMVSAARKNPIRSMINHNHATKMRNFEGSQAGRARDSD